MPLLAVGQRHSWVKQPPYNFYRFPDEHRGNWKTFWEEMDGDREKILAFAEKSDIECPCEWFESLHWFLFDIFSGDEKLMRKASKGGFGSFLAQVATNHINSPKEKEWYFLKGVTPENFIRVVETAAEIDDIRHCVAYVNARMKEFGSALYSEFLLSKVVEKKELKSIASELNKKAYALEKQAGHFINSAKNKEKKILEEELERVNNLLEHNTSKDTVQDKINLSQYRLELGRQLSELDKAEKQIKQEQAQEAEIPVTGSWPRMKEGNIVKHSLFPGEEFEVVHYHTERDNIPVRRKGLASKLVATETRNILTVKDKNGKVGYISDLWNLERN